MSNYSTSYNISQSGNLYTLEDHGTGKGLAQYTSTRGTTVNAPMNGRNLKLFRNFDNEYFFFIKNQDRKPIMLSGMEIIGSLINRESKVTVVTTRCQIIDADLGSCKFVVQQGDTYNLDEGYYDMVLSYKNEMGMTLPLFTDTNMRPNFTVEVVTDASPNPILTQESTELFDTANDGHLYTQRMAGPVYFGKKGGLITAAVYATGYTGKLYIQGTTSNQPEEGDWFDLMLGMTTNYYQFNAFTGIEPFNTVSNLKYIRAKVENTGLGTVDKVLLRV